MALTPEGAGAAREREAGPGAEVAGTAGTRLEGTADAGWLRVHPASPFVRGWVALAAMLFFFGRDTFERAAPGRPGL